MRARARHRGITSKVRRARPRAPRCRGRLERARRTLRFAFGCVGWDESLSGFRRFGLRPPRAQNVDFSQYIVAFAAILGDAVNYSIGRKLGMKVFENPNSKIFKKEYLEKTQAFYERYGGKTIIIARFVPIVRAWTLL